jgi:hypothetical protein
VRSRNGLERRAHELTASDSDETVIVQEYMHGRVQLHGLGNRLFYFTVRCPQMVPSFTSVTTWTWTFEVYKMHPRNSLSELTTVWLHPSDPKSSCIPGSRVRTALFG